MYVLHGVTHLNSTFRRWDVIEAHDEVSEPETSTDVEELTGHAFGCTLIQVHHGPSNSDGLIWPLTS